MLKIVNRACTAALIAIFATAWIPHQALAQLLRHCGRSLIVTSPASGATVGGTVPVSATSASWGLSPCRRVVQLAAPNLGARILQRRISLLEHEYRRQRLAYADRGRAAPVSDDTPRRP
jgi:hypothetical protein